MREPVMCCLEGGVSDIVCRAAGGGVRMRDGQPGQEGQSPAPGSSGFMLSALTASVPLPLASAHKRH